MIKNPSFVSSIASSILRSATLRQSSITGIGTIINGALGAFFYILLAIYIGPSAFGIFTLCITVLTLVADIGDMGTNSGLVNFISRFRKTDEKKAFSYMKLGLVIKVSVSLFVIIVGWFISPFLAVSVFQKPDIVLPIRIAFIGVAGQLLHTFLLQCLQAYERFILWSSVQILGNAFRLALIILLFFGGYLTLESSLTSYVVIPLLSFAFGFFLLPIKFLKVNNIASVSSTFFRYNAWVALFAILAALSARLDTFISGRLLSAEELGLYGLAGQMVAVVPQLVGALGTVIAPKMAHQKDVFELLSYLKKTQILVGFLALVGLAGIPVVLALIPFLGSAYMGTGPIFTILLIGMLVFLVSVPVHQAVFHYFEYPKLFVWISIGHFFIIALGGWYLILNYGMYGAAYTVLIGNTFNFLVPLCWVLWKLKQELSSYQPPVTNN